MSIIDITDKFIMSPVGDNAYKLLEYLRSKGLYHLGVLLGKHFSNLFSYHKDVLDEYGVCCYYTHQFEKAFDIFKQVRDTFDLTLSELNTNISNTRFCIPHVKDRYITYPKTIIERLTTRNTNSFSMVTFTITSCKRFNLFVKTMNSFLNCCEDIDLIDRWICIDDNSSEEDRKKMKAEYPFFTFIFKDVGEKGHPRSMNMLRDIVDTPYVFHMEDDWQFILKKKYISECLSILNSSHIYGQCLINKNYAETFQHLENPGGILKKDKMNNRYFIHEYYPTNPPKKFMGKSNCAYWPHYSFRPSLLRSKIWLELGKFDEQANHFEMVYSYKYEKAGYKSVFLDGIYSLHIGRLTSERNDKTKTNAYELNGEKQFTGKTKAKVKVSLKFDVSVKTVVVNLDRRVDRWNKFTALKEPKFLNYERYSAVDGKDLVSTPQLQRLFNDNDYRWRRGMIGCALSHLKLWTELINSSDHEIYIILEDDITFTPNFKEKLMVAYHQLKESDWDLFYLGHSLHRRYRLPSHRDPDKIPICQKWDKSTIFTRSMGGTIGYMINKRGAMKLLNFINEVGMTNCIDTMQQKSADVTNIYYCYPHLVFSDVYENGGDSNIQTDHTTLEQPINQRLQTLREDLAGRGVTRVNTTQGDTIHELLKYHQVVFYSADPPLIKKWQQKFPLSYKIGQRGLIITLDKKYWLDRLKKDDDFTVEKIIKYK